MALFSDKRPSVVLGGIATNVISDMDLYLEKQDLVILVDTHDDSTIVEELCRSKAIIETDKQLVFISRVAFPKKPGKHIYLTVTEKELETILELYRTYEASDKLVVLSDSGNYGGVWNYVYTGVLSWEEAFESLLK